jgi:predicted nucleic-acid-binding Zn-ribbon protein
MDTRIKKGVLDDMMKKVDVKKSMVYTIDLTKIDGDGAFPCPKCGSVISPEDETDTTYEIVETRVKGDDLEELVLTCKKCGTTIKLVGFMSQPQA